MKEELWEGKRRDEGGIMGGEKERWRRNYGRRKGGMKEELWEDKRRDERVIIGGEKEG